MVLTRAPGILKKSVANKNLAPPPIFEIFLNAEIKLPFIKIKNLHLIARCNIINDHRAIWWEASSLLLNFFADYHIISTRHCNLRVKKNELNLKSWNHSRQLEYTSRQWQLDDCISRALQMNDYFLKIVVAAMFSQKFRSLKKLFGQPNFNMFVFVSAF